MRDGGHTTTTTLGNTNRSRSAARPTMPSMRLHFKGDKPDKKKKKRKHSDRPVGDQEHRQREESDVEDVGGDETAWVDVERPEDIAGPVLIFQSYGLRTSGPNAKSKQMAICLNPHLSRIELADVTPLPSEAPLASTSKEQAELLEGATIVTSEDLASHPAAISSDVGPSDVHQVLVASRVLDTRDPPRYTFRTTQHRFLGADKHGAILCSAEARGPQEEWAIESAETSGSSEAGIALRNHVHGSYLSLDEVAGGKLVVRADSTSIGEGEVWKARVQWKFRHQSRKAEREREIGRAGTARLRMGTANPVKLDEATLNKLRSDVGTSLNSDDAKAERRALKRALREGRAAEEMLDRRVKMKSDKFA
ncbi:unnamed protein product [Parajaminaea phylloscopi]